MGLLNQTNPTLQDVASRTKDGVIQDVIEVLSETNDLFLEGSMIEANDTTSHKTVIRSGLPTGTWRLLNKGIQPSKSRSVKQEDTMGMLAALSEVDIDLANLNNNAAAFRKSEDVAFLQSMAKTIAETTIYGNSGVDPEKFMGLAPRFDDLSAESAANILLGGGSGADNTSIWLVGWSDKTAHYIYPKGSKAGLQFKDKGELFVLDSDSNKFLAYVTHFKHDIGLSVPDWRYVVRICNIDVSELRSDMGGSSAKLPNLMTQALELIEDTQVTRKAFYCNKTIRSMLRQQFLEVNKLQIGTTEIAGKRVVAYDEVPVRRVDAILNTEATVS